MVSPAALVWVAIALVRLFMRRSKVRSNVTVRLPQRRFVGLFAAAILTLLFWSDNSALVFGLLVVSGVVGLSHELAAAVSIPLGLPRLTWVLYRLGGGNGPPAERRASADLAAARALVRRPSEAAARFIERDLATCVELGTSGAVAMALLSLSRGDCNQAHAIFRLIDTMGDHALPVAARIAREHLMVDAFVREDWRRVEEYEKRAKGSRLATLLASVARRKTNALRAPSTAVLWMTWLIAPRRRVTHALVVDALKVRHLSPPVPVAASLDAYVKLLASWPIAARREDFAAAVQSLDALRTSPAVLAGIEKRGLALGLTADGKEMCDAILRDAEEDLAQAVLEAGWPATWAPRGITGDAIRARVEQERVSRAEGLVAELERRSRHRVDLSENDEWRAWADARSAIGELLCDNVPPATAFSIVFAQLMAYAVRLTNVRARRILAGDVFRVLQDLAHQGRASHTYELVDRNVTAVKADGLPPEKELHGESIGDLSRVASLRDVVLPRALGAVVGVGVIAMVWLLAAEKFFLAGACAWTTFAAMFSFALTGHFVQCAWSVEGLVVQSRRLRFVAQFADIATVGAGPGALVRVRLYRAPRWLPRVVFTLARSRAEAEAHAARVPIARAASI